MVLSSDDPATHRKPCTICHTPRDVLIRCQIDDSGTWHLICPGSCWKTVSGGVEDGDADHPDYRYGGMWKNRWADVTAKKPKKVKERQKAKHAPKEWSMEAKYTTNDRVLWDGKVWVCRKGHRPREGEEPGNAKYMWKEEDGGSEDEDDGDGAAEVGAAHAVPQEADGKDVGDERDGTSNALSGAS